MKQYYEVSIRTPAHCLATSPGIHHPLQTKLISRLRKVSRCYFQN